MTNAAELVKRLRRHPPTPTGLSPAVERGVQLIIDLCDVTADHIETQQAEIERVEANLKAAGRQNEILLEGSERMEALAAKAERVVEAADLVIESGRAMRSDPGNHELFLARLCSAMADLAAHDKETSERPEA